MASRRHDRDASQHPPEGKQLEIVLNISFTLPPNALTVAAMATAINAAISAYSIAVTAESSDHNKTARLSKALMRTPFLTTTRQPQLSSENSEGRGRAS